MRLELEIKKGLEEEEKEEREEEESKKILNNSINNEYIRDTCYTAAENKEEKYNILVNKNKELNITTPSEYKYKQDMNPFYEERPENCFEDNGWVNWHEFLSVKVSCSKEEFIAKSKDIYEPMQNDFNKETYDQKCKEKNIPYFKQEELFNIHINKTLYGLDNPTRRR